MKLSRGPKRAVIIFVYLILFSLIGWGIYKLVKPAPSCFDGKKNQNELGVDCGGVCAKECPREIKVQDVAVDEAAFVPGGEGKYDLVAKITNPNINFGTKALDYTFTLKDATGNVLAERKGTDFILPKETKYVIETEVAASGSPASASFTISRYDWQEFSGFEEPRLEIVQKEFHEKSENIIGSDAYGMLVNKSPYDFYFVKVNIVLRDEAGKVMALGKTSIGALNANEQRDFRITWPEGLIRGAVSERGVEMEPEANIFDSQNFMRKYLPGEKSQPAKKKQ